MARITLLQQWEDLEAKIAAFKEEQINRFFETNYKPERIYRCNRMGEIFEYPVFKFSVWYDGVYHPCNYRKKPTTTHVNLLEAYYQAIQTAKPTIMVCYKTGISTGAEAYDKITGIWGFEFSDLEEKAKELKELYAPREGYAPCRYCGKQVPIENLIKRTIIGRDRKQVWNSWKGIYESKACVTQESFKFCSEQCAANEQMSREG